MKMSSPHDVSPKVKVNEDDILSVDCSLPSCNWVGVTYDVRHLLVMPLNLTYIALTSKLQVFVQLVQVSSLRRRGRASLSRAQVLVRTCFPIYVNVMSSSFLSN